MKDYQPVIYFHKLSKLIFEVIALHLMRLLKFILTKTSYRLVYIFILNYTKVVKA